MRDSVRAAALAAVLVGWSFIAPRLPQRWNPLPQMLFGLAVVGLERPPLGLRPPQLWRGLTWGSAAAAPVLLAVGTSIAVPMVREGMGDRRPTAPPGRWLLLGIPFGTVWPEEVTYRGALGTVSGRAFGDAAGRLFTAAVFGMSHIPDARANNEPVLGTVLVTGAAGWVFSWLHAKSASLAAPMLAHLAANEAGAIAALVVSRRLRRTSTTPA
ncbi:CPBP family intramembrane glutamic endopeptidase [Mycobacterium sp. 236(2023)]|uniref:Rv0804 family intramembrane glutamic endopeptidase n=1 Tax=Mycobacterium sp. 236(2023) TaxID=3038163 RepID=UPI0024157AFF|nr:CPBP family intramembrane glutamic endopeptidase [Mycobacterium sp. 236(2023)]MDG4665539.1 CPBP family intramembrane metalloprotease [Mycobacterium sp. 236(2023)]